MDSPYPPRVEVDVQPIVLEVFDDGACPLCDREVAMLRRRDRAQSTAFIDISSPSFEPTSVARADSSQFVVEIL